MKTLLLFLLTGAAMAETNVEVGETASIGGAPVKVVKVRPSRDDATPEHRKATVSIEVGSGEAFDIGQYGEESVYWQNHLVSLEGSTGDSATIRVSPFTFTLDVSAFDKKVARSKVTIGKPFTLHDLVITVKALGHVREYGSYFTLPVDIEHQGFSLTAQGIESAALEIRPVGLNEKFEPTPRDYPAATVMWGGYALHLGAGKSDGFEPRRGPFELTRSTP